MNCVTDVVKLGVAVRRRTQLLEADHVIGRQHIAERCERNVRDLRDLRRGLAGRQRRAVEAAAREAEAELIDRTSGVRCPGVLADDAVGARQRLADVGRGECAAAVGKRRGRSRIVAQVRVAGEDLVTRVRSSDRCAQSN